MAEAFDFTGFSGIGATTDLAVISGFEVFLLRTGRWRLGFVGASVVAGAEALTCDSP